MLQTIDEPTTPLAQASDDDDDYRKLFEALAFDPATSDELAESTGLTIDQVSSMLLILELEGNVEAIAGGRYSRLKK
jgi:DNA processing protein